MKVTSFALLAADALAESLLAAALEALAELADALADSLLAAALEADVLAELADALAAELEACWPQPASTTESASATATASTEKSFELRFMSFPLVFRTFPYERAAAALACNRSPHSPQ